MTADEKARWDERYSSGDYEPRTEPAPLVELGIHYISPGRALVLACGAGRNALRLAEAGFEVEALDVSSVAIGMATTAAEELGVDVNWRVADLDEAEFEPESYDLITMIRYNNRNLWSAMIDALKPNGWILMEQHLHTRRDVVGPSGPFRVQPGEILKAFKEFRIVEYFEAFGPFGRDGETTATNGILACKGDPGW